ALEVVADRARIAAAILVTHHPPADVVAVVAAHRDDAPVQVFHLIVTGRGGRAVADAGAASAPSTAGATRTTGAAAATRATGAIAVGGAHGRAGHRQAIDVGQAFGARGAQDDAVLPSGERDVRADGRPGGPGGRGRESHAGGDRAPVHEDVGLAVRRGVGVSELERVGPRFADVQGPLDAGARGVVRVQVTGSGEPGVRRLHHP